MTDSFAQMADDAVYDGNAHATAGSLSFTSPDLTWTGDLAPGAAAVITYTVTVNNPDTGDKLVINTVTSADTGSTCPPGATTTACRVTVSVLTPALTIAMTASPATATPGSTVSYTVTVTNTGQTPYTGASVTDSLAGVLDDAAYNGDAPATAGSVSFASPDLTWTGDLALGATAPSPTPSRCSNPDTGNEILASTVTSATAGNNCPAGGTDPRCASHGGCIGAHDHEHGQREHHHPRLRGGLHHHHHQQRADPLQRRGRHRPAGRHPGRRRLQLRRHRDHRIGHLHQP